ncbi:MAG: thioredoxin domain-containing protein [Gemmatimonadetes bacterium]|nr:thioredoxin domain-containing protein [Gemmatimonadota bacterium]
MPNRLQHESSPYLRQHASNPVDWFPWGAEALARAAAEDKPILLSIGYAACHWCHVMEHESFADEATAALMNEHFVCIKVDREERPDLDSIYMQAVQAMTGHGGWPMTVFLTPAGEPFYGGTYFPPVERHGMPSFKRLLLSISDAYRHKRDSVASTTSQLRELFEGGNRLGGASGELARPILDRAARALASSFDAEHGGFGDAPKFPPSMSLDFLLRHWARTGTEQSLDIARRTFSAMSRGGLHDQVGGGIHRYSVDERWLVPHFEKMLYDNALFARLGLHLWQATGEPEVRRTTRQLFTWLTREMTSPEGGFYSSLDADSEGHEGTFYLWSDDQVESLLRGDAEIVREYWGVRRGGNFEGRTILHVAVDPSVVARRHGLSLHELDRVVERARTTLYAERSRRPWPALDDKVIAAWNGLMLRAVADGARILGDAELRALALRNGAFLREHMVRDGRVARSWRSGEAKPFGFLEDHAAVALGFLDLYALTFDASWLGDAMAIADVAIARFFDPASGRFYDTANDHEALITRPRDVTDNATPSGNSLMADLLMRLSVMTGEGRGEALALAACRSVSSALERHPSAFGHLLGVADMALYGATEVVLVGDEESASFRSLREVVAGQYLPSLVLAGGVPTPESPFPLLHARSAPAGGATAYVCQRARCDVPTSDPAVLTAQLEAIR